MTQRSLFPSFDATPATPAPSSAFSGVTYDPPQDFARLNAQCLRVYDAMKGGTWMTLRELALETGDPEASVSARLRDLRKPKFGGFNVERRRQHEGSGTWEYRLE